MNKPQRQAGFTIVELLVATAIFSTIMLVMMVAILQFSRAYYRGITNSTTQTTARAIVDEVSQAIQFSGSDVMTLANTVCVGTSQYDSKPYAQLDGSSATHGLYATPRNGTCTAKPNFVTGSADPKQNSRELLGPNMRLVKFNVQPASAQVYTINVKIANGDDDLLCNPGASGSDGKNDCNSGLNDNNHKSLIKNGNIKCRPITGSQFCSVVELNVSVQKRIN